MNERVQKYLLEETDPHAEKGDRYAPQNLGLTEMPQIGDMEPHSLLA